PLLWHNLSIVHFFFFLLIIHIQPPLRLNLVGISIWIYIKRMLLRRMEQKHENGERDSIDCVSLCSRYFRICSWLMPATVIPTPSPQYTTSTQLKQNFMTTYSLSTTPQSP